MDRNELITKIRNFMREEHIDSLLVNTCDEFLLEYNAVETCPRYIITGFTGSAGDALLTADELYLFADGRYHIQAEQETDRKVVSVYKLCSGERYSDALCSKIQDNSTFAVCGAKISSNFYDIVEKKLSEKNVKIKVLDEDVVLKFAGIEKISEANELYEVPEKISGKTNSEKIHDIQSELNEGEIALFSKPEDVAYITNLRGNYIEYSSSFKAYLLVEKSNVILFTNDKTEDTSLWELKKLEESRDVLAEKAKTHKIIYEKNSVNLEIFNIIKNNGEALAATDGNNFFSTKSIKNDAEIEHYKEIYKKTDKVVEYINELVHSDKHFSEYDLAEIVETEFRKLGAKALSFKTILAFGENTALIHYTKNSKERYLKDGELVLLDCGAYFEGGLATDITRTFVRGKASPEQKHLYTTVLRGFINGYLLGLTEQSVGKNIDSKVRETLDNANLEGFSFPHGTGHGVGISVHEAPPSVSPSVYGEKELKTGMIFSIEPGLYKENFGGVRIENIVYIDKNFKMHSLSRAKFEEELIDFSMLNDEEKKFIIEWNKKND